jgi:hypothetical protein
VDREDLDCSSYYWKGTLLLRKLREQAFPVSIRTEPRPSTGHCLGLCKEERRRAISPLTSSRSQTQPSYVSHTLLIFRIFWPRLCLSCLAPRPSPQLDALRIKRAVRFPSPATGAQRAADSATHLCLAASACASFPQSTSSSAPRLRHTQVWLSPKSSNTLTFWSMRRTIALVKR